MRKRSAGFAVCVVLATVISVIGTAFAAPGDLDLTWGSTGKVMTDFAGGPDVASALVIQADGKVVAAGRTATTGLNDFALARYNTDGSLDSTFGTGGEVTTDFGTSSADSEDQANALVLQPDGKIVAAGLASGDTAVFALARYNTDGSLDSTFGTGGKVTTDINSGASASALVLQPDGKLVAAGAGGGDFALARYDTNGSLDSTFGVGGVVTTDFGPTIEGASALALQADGKLVAAGYWFSFVPMDFELARYNSDGSLDSTFGVGGKVTTDIGSGSSDLASALVVQADGKLVVAGRTNFDFALVRYETDGSLDATFGTGGTVTTDFGSVVDWALALALQSDSKLVAAGLTSVGGTWDFALARYKTDGSLDATFGTGGEVTTDFSGGFESASALAIQSDGKIVAAGGTTGGTDDFALARYLPDEGAPAADLSVTITDTPDPVKAKHSLTYTMVVTNNGPSAAQGVALSQTLPIIRSLGATVSSSQGSCTLNVQTQSTSCALGSLASGSSATITVSVKPRRTGTATSTASVFAASPTDPNAANDQATTTTQVT